MFYEVPATAKEVTVFDGVVSHKLNDTKLSINLDKVSSFSYVSDPNSGYWNVLVTEGSFGTGKGSLTISFTTETEAANCYNAILTKGNGGSN